MTAREPRLARLILPTLGSLVTLAALSFAATGAAGVAPRSAGAAARRAADPNELYERSVRSLEQGDLRGSAAAAAQLRDLVRTRPEWDPEGTFGKVLLPPLQAKIGRLQAAAAALDRFSERALADLKPPDLKSEISTVKDYTHWATSVVQRLRSERDELVASSLASPDEAAILRRTPSYARTERLFEVEVLRQMADRTGDDILGLLSGDPRLESVLVRFRQLKRDLMQTIAERDDLQARLKDADARRQTLLDALANAAIDEDDTPAKGTKGRDALAGASPAARFIRSLKTEREALRRQGPVTPAERDALEAKIERLRLSNQVLAAAGIVPDQAETIASLGRLVTALPGRDAPAPAPSRGGSWLPWAFATAFGAGAGIFARLAFDRGRRLRALESRPARFDSTPPHAGGADAGQRAA
jgi:hypothetical protein